MGDGRTIVSLSQKFEDGTRGRKSSHVAHQIPLLVHVFVFEENVDVEDTQDMWVLRWEQKIIKLVFT